MKKSSFFSLISFATIVLLQSCEYIQQDPVDPRLNKYTETGENTAGAVVNDTVWNTELQPGIIGQWKNEMYFYNYVNKDSIIFVFPSDYNSMIFSIKGLGIRYFTDFEKIRNKKIALDGVNASGSYIPLNSYDIYMNYHLPLASGKGQIYFRNIKYMGDSLIISGGFGFKQDLENITVSHGRFDYVLRKSMFGDAIIE